jgi:7-cyano-7-deazaguanine synthase
VSAQSTTSVVLLSGGLDSVVAAALWLEHGGSIALCLTMDYGQRAADREAEAALRFSRARGLSHRVLALPWLAELSRQKGTALVNTAQSLPQGTLAAPGDERSAKAVWVPARNAVFLAIAAAHAETLGAGTVVAGFNREEAATFSDNSEAFVVAASAFLALGAQPPVAVASPTLAMDKRAIVQNARRLGIRPADLWSCYASGPAPCGSCESCLRSARAWV